MTEHQKPLPPISPDTKEFWEGLRRHQLLIQRCQDCGTYRHYPRPMCHNCNSMNGQWVKVRGRGKVYSWIVSHYTVHPAFPTPYLVAIVELEEGVRMITNLVDTSPDEVYIGMPVEVFFEDVTEEITLPLFKPIDKGSRRT